MSRETGIFFDLAMAEYRQAEGINISSLKDMSISPAHYRAKVDEPPSDPTPAQVIGTITHSAVLENDFTGFVVQPDDYDGRTKEGKAWKAAQTKQPIDRETASNIAGMVNSVRNHPMALRVLYDTPGHCEVSGWKIHPATGLMLKGRADRLTTDAKGNTCVVDLKTCQRGEASLELFAKQIFNWKYYQQASFYLNVFDASFFIFVAVEKEAPFAVSCYNLDIESLNLGQAENEKSLALVRQCTDSGIWPAYSADLTQINIPQWAIRKAST